ncbi:MAG TPA: hypothetical protein VJB57_09020 [Dehalococcoidia bacterium]|nr:hypothetical protein [Dehalococcoidia bacterium]
MSDDSGSDTRIKVVEMRPNAPEVDDGRVLRVVRESLRLDPPVVEFAPQSKRYLGFFH